MALGEFGTLSFADVIAPAIELADGMALDETRANAIVRSRRFFDLWPTSKAVFLQAGQMPQPGDVFRQPDLARTLRAMVAAEQRALKARRLRGKPRSMPCAITSIAAKLRTRSTPSARPTAVCFAMRIWRRSG